MWVATSCPQCRCRLIFNGRKPHHWGCPAELVVHWAGRSIRVDPPAYLWKPSRAGDSIIRIRRPQGPPISQQGNWMPVKGLLTKPDRRKVMPLSFSEEVRLWRS